MMVGRILKAKKNPYLPMFPGFPNSPKTKEEPAMEKPRNLSTPLPASANSQRPTGNRSTKTAKANCKPKPQRMVFRRIARRFVENRTPSPNRVMMPRIPTKRCILFLCLSAQLKVCGMATSKFQLSPNHLVNQGPWHLRSDRRHVIRRVQQRERFLQTNVGVIPHGADRLACSDFVTQLLVEDEADRGIDGILFL